MLFYTLSRKGNNLAYVSDRTLVCFFVDELVMSFEMGYCCKKPTGSGLYKN